MAADQVSEPVSESGAPAVPPTEPLAALLEQVTQAAVRFLGTLDERPVWARASYDEMLQALGGPLPQTSSDAADVVAELARLAEPGLSASASGRFFGFVIGGVHPAGLGADWLTSVWDQNSGLTALTPASAASEAVAAGWLLELLGLPATASVGFVTGGMQANFTCLAAARHDVLARAGWDVERRGLVAAPPVRVVAGADRHDTVDLALRYLGLGTDAIVEVATDDQGRIVLDRLADVLDAGTGPTIVCLQAGEVHTGAFDPLAAASDLAHHRGAWVHVDGAFGLWAGAAGDPDIRALAAGADRANSWATDGHKTLNVPYDCGFAIVRDRVVHRSTFGVHGEYLISTDAGDPMDLVPELSRRARGFPVWAVLRSLGRTGVADLVDGLCRNARRLADGIAAIPGASVLNDVVFTQVVLSFGDDDTTREVAHRVLTEGTAVLTPSTWRGQAVLRCSISNWSTTSDDIDRTLAALTRIAAEVRGSA
ncbi:MAG TPA: aminotransferase class V-fold PLP-dependent enzyme [Acidimicrobiales bacterium]|jgi:glutamate/tyrosine decarboxylase-like PLP-dependent enzyme|nr:aminotransferase class V-fold PLP-dependent enzyme [Acidimicrobiales bacterium]